MEKGRAHTTRRASEVAAAARGRAAWVGDLKMRTVAMLASARRERQAGWAAVKGALDRAAQGRCAERRQQAAEAARQAAAFCREQTQQARRLRLALAGAAQAAAADIRAAITAWARGRADVARERAHDFQRDSAQRAGEWRDQSRAIRDILADLHLSRGEMAQDLAARLGDFVRALRASVSCLLADAGALRIRQAAAGEDTRRRTRAEIRARTAQLASEARILLGASRRGRTERHRRLRADLAHGGHEHQDAMGHKAQESEAAPGAEPSMSEGPLRRAWEHLVGRSGEPTEAAPGVTAHRETEPAKPRKAEEAKRSRDAWAKLSDEDKILQVIRQHPDGISATQIGELVELHPSMAGRIATELAERGAVEKNESARLYFPVSRR